MIKTYSNIYDYLKNITNEINQKNTKNIKKGVKDKVNFIDTINYSKSDTFFTQNFEKLLKTKLNDPEAFSLKSKQERQKFQDSIDSISHDEFEWKLYGKK